MSDLKKGVLSSFLLVADSILKKLVGLVSTLILARLLVPEDFGIIAIATLMIGFIDILANTGSVQYLMRVDNLDESKINTSWTINLILRSFMCLIMFIASVFVAEFYNDPRLIYVLVSFTIIFFIYALKNPGLAFLRRSQNYVSIVKLGVFVKVISVIAAVIAAFTLQNYWALVIGKASSAIIFVVGSYFIHSHRPKLELVNAKEQWEFSGWVIPQSIFGYIRTQLDSLLVSTNFGQEQLGSYHTMKYISFIPSAFLIIPATEPFLVELNKSKNSSHYFAKQFNASFFITMLLGLPISLVMYLHHDLVTSVILGPNWLEYSNLLGIFGLLIPALIMFHQASRVLILFGKTKHLFIYECITFVILYSTLLFVGIKDLLLFSYVRVGMENLICSAFLTYVLLKYTSVGNTLSLILGFIPFGISAYIAYSLSNLVSVENLHDFFQLCVVTAAFFSAFYGSMLLFHLVFLRKLQEWMYLEQLVLRVCSPVISRLK